MLAAAKGNEKVIILLVEKSANINDVDNRGFTALIFASINGHRLLLDAGADIDSKSLGGLSAIKAAYIKFHGGALALLIEKGADISEVNDMESFGKK